MRTSIPRWTSDARPNQASDIVAFLLDARVSKRLLIKGPCGNAVLLRTETTQRGDGSSVIAVRALRSNTGSRSRPRLDADHQTFNRVRQKLVSGE